MIAQYELAAGTAPKVTNVYDGPGESGLLSSSTNAMAQRTSYMYDTAGREQNVGFSDATPARSDGYDGDGRVVSIASPAWGSALSQSYDRDGRLVRETEPSGLGSAGILSYGYYADGKRAALSLSIPSLGISLPQAFAYSYRADGALQTQRVNAGRGGSYAWTYTPAGRELTQQDPSTGASFTATAVTTRNGTTTYPVTYLPRTTTYDAYGREKRLQ